MRAKMVQVSKGACDAVSTRPGIWQEARNVVVDLGLFVLNL